jgi:hypothetical protein
MVAVWRIFAIPKLEAAANTNTREPGLRRS